MALKKPAVLLTLVSYNLKIRDFFNKDTSLCSISLHCHSLFFPLPFTPNLRSPMYSNLVFWPLHFKICSLWPHPVCILSAKSCIGFVVKRDRPVDHDGLQPIYTDSKSLFPFMLFWSCHEHVWAFLLAKYFEWCLLASWEESWMRGGKRLQISLFPSHLLLCFTGVL